MSFIELHVVFLTIGLLLLVLEVLMGLTLGVALSGAVTFFILGLASWMKLISGFNAYLAVGGLVFVVSTFVVLKYFKNRARQSQESQDVNDY